MFDCKILGNGMPTNLVPCLHPISVKVHGESILVPCGHCAKCVSTRLNIQSSLTNRLFTLFKYCIFVTLTYDEENVPKFTTQLKDGKFTIKFLNRDIKPDSPLLDIGELTSQDIDSIDDIWNDPKYNYRSKSYIRYIHKEDYQLYLKRVKRYVEKNFPGTEYTYVGCTEYGEQYLRPHVHLLFFVESSSAFLGMLKYFRNYNKTNNTGRSIRWPYGHVDAQPVNDGNVASYVSSYVSSSVTTPAILKRKQLRGKFFHAQAAGYFPLKDVASKVRALPVPEVVRYVVSESDDDKERLWKWSDFCKFFRRFSDIDFARNYGFTSFLASLKSFVDKCESRKMTLSQYAHFLSREICFYLSRSIHNVYFKPPLLFSYYTSGISLTHLASYDYAVFEENSKNAYCTLFGRIYHSLLVYRHFRTFTISSISVDEVSQIKALYEKCEQIVEGYRLHCQYAKLSLLDDPSLVDNYFSYFQNVDMSEFDESQVFISYFDNLIARKDKTKRINEPTLFNNK